MTAVTDCESSYPLPCSAPHPSTSSQTQIFLSPGQTVPQTPTVSPLSPLHFEHVLVSPITVSLIPPCSTVLDKVGPTSPQHQVTAAPQQSVRSEASHSQTAFISALTVYPSHTAPSQNTYPPTNDSTQPLIKVIMMAETEYRYLLRVREENLLIGQSLSNCSLHHKKVYLCWKIITIFMFKLDSLNNDKASVMY